LPCPSSLIEIRPPTDNTMKGLFLACLTLFIAGPTAQPKAAKANDRFRRHFG
jgi:hypothetical protein